MPDTAEEQGSVADRNAKRGEAASDAPIRKRGRPRASKPIAPPADFQLPELMPAELTNRLARGIIFGDHEPGTRFVEEDIAAAFQVSRSPVREAFRRLEADGLVVREARRGVRVTPMSIEDLDEVYSCRMELEGLAAEQAAARGPRHCVDIEDAFEQLRDAHSSNDRVRYFDSNLAFTAFVHNLSGNKTLIRMLQGLTQQALRYRFLAYRRVPTMMDYSLKANRDLVDAIAKGDAGISRDVSRLLVSYAWSRIRKAIS